MVPSLSITSKWQCPSPMKADDKIHTAFIRDADEPRQPWKQKSKNQVGELTFPNFKLSTLQSHTSQTPRRTDIQIKEIERPKTKSYISDQILLNSCAQKIFYRKSLFTKSTQGGLKKLTLLVSQDSGGVWNRGWATWARSPHKQKTIRQPRLSGRCLHQAQSCCLLGPSQHQGTLTPHTHSSYSHTKSSKPKCYYSTIENVCSFPGKRNRVTMELVLHHNQASVLLA